MEWFKKKRDIKTEKKVKIPEGLWVKCDNCKDIIYKKEIEKNLKVCPKCNYHFRIVAEERILWTVDEGSFVELDRHMITTDPLNFEDTKSYKKRIKESIENTNLNDALVYGTATIHGRQITIAVMDFSFMGGSMGSVVGEKITRAAELSLSNRVPFITIASSGGARMQEGMFSLMQMAKVSAAISRLKETNILYISVLVDPTFGGVSASFAMLGDIIIAEPKSLIGFAGPRVIEQTIKQQLPDNFQRAEFLLQHGMIDLIVERKDLKDTLYKLINNFCPINIQKK